MVMRTQAPNTTHQVPEDLEFGIGNTPTSALGLDSLLLTLIFTAVLSLLYFADIIQITEDNFSSVT